MGDHKIVSKFIGVSATLQVQGHAGHQQGVEELQMGPVGSKKV